MSYRRILGTVTILSAAAIATSPVAANPTQIVDFAPNSYTLQSTQSKQIDFTLHITRTQSFAEIMQKAELTATNLIERGFAENSRLREMSVRIFGERNGQEAPLLFAKVSRLDWQKQPRIQSWSQYFTSSGVLLGLLGETQSSSPTPTAPTFRPPTPPTSSTPSFSAPPVPIPSPPAVQPSGNTPPPPRNSRPGGASLEEEDPGYR
jgi:hypothetical protein